MRVILEPAYVLHRRPYRETSLLVEAFAAGHGRIGLLGRGARRGRSPWRGLLEPFQALLLSWSGGGELKTLTAVEQGKTGRELGGRALLSGLYVNELIMRLVQREEPQPALFRAYGEALGELAGSEGCEESVLRVFEKRLLEALGYGLALRTETERGRPVEPRARYRYVVERGPVMADPGAHPGTVSGATLLALADERVAGEEALREAKWLMRRVLRSYLGERPLASRALFARRPGPAGDG